MERDPDLAIFEDDEDEHHEIQQQPTAASVLQLLKNAWVNEKYSPELLRHESDLVDCMMDQIKQMEENVEGVDRNDFRLVPHQMEVDRIRFIISSYLRTRLEKIETFAMFLLKRDKDIANIDDRYLSKGEFTFAEAFLNNLKLHCHDEAFKYMPTLVQEYGEGVPDMIVQPNLNSSVFVKMVKTVSGALVCNEITELAAGSRHLMPYKDIMEYIEDGSALLI